MRTTALIALSFLAFATPANVHAQSGQEKQILGLTKANWIAFRDYNGRQLIYFTHLESWKCGISAVRYSINDTSLNETWTLQPCDPANPNAVTTDKPYISLPLNTAQSVSVQLTFKDGTTSTVETFRP